MKGPQAPALIPGIYCPTVTFFQDTPEQELDLDAFATHVTNLAEAGLHGVVCQGSSGEAVTLSREERKTLISLARDCFKKALNPGVVIAGVGAHTTKQSIELSIDAAEAGASYTLVLPPSYYTSLMTSDALKAFYLTLADASPIPVIIYAYPGVSSGINMESSLLMELARHPNIYGVKHTDHDLGKIARESALDAKKAYGSPFTVLGGATDYLIGTLALGGEGSISSMTNVTPRATVKVFELFKAGKFAEALQIGAAISVGEAGLSKGSIRGVKWALSQYSTISPKAVNMRHPILPCDEAIKDVMRTALAPAVEIEKQLEKQGYAGILSRATNGH